MKRDKVITGGEELVCRVIDKYHREDVELSSLFFDVHVRMPKKEILRAYAKCQEIINGDEVVRVEDGVIQDELVPEEEQFDQVYDGSCMEFLESFNGQTRFRRYMDENEWDADNFIL